MLIAVRIAEYEWDEMCDLKTLKQWARSGKLKPTDLIKVDGEWVEARHASVLKGIFAASTWDVDEDVIWTPKAKYPSSKKTMLSGVKTSVHESQIMSSSDLQSHVQSQDSPNKDSRLSSSEMQPLHSLKNSQTNQPNVNTDSPNYEPSSSKDSAEKSQKTKGSSEGTLSFADEVALEYQRTKPTPNLNTSTEDVNSSTSYTPTSGAVEFKDRGQLWNPSVEIKDQLGLLVDDIPRKGRFSWIRLMILVLPGAFIIFFAREIVITEATTTFPTPTGSSGPQASDASTLNTNAPIPTKAQSDTLFTLESNLKGMLRNNAQQVTPEQSLSDALRIDLEYVGLEILRIDAKVLKWKGRMLDKPRAATIEIILSSQGEMENELILATLVIAKYSVLYYLEMPQFTVNIRDGDLLLTKIIQTADAQFLYLQPGSLEKFIEILSK